VIEEQLKKLADVLPESGKCENEDREIIIYGLSSAIELGVNIITTIILGFLFGLILESLIFLISFSFLRTYAGGYHCQKAINCYLMSSGIVALVLAIIKFTPIECMIIIGVAMLLVSVPILLKLAPVGTPSKPLDVDERKHNRKKTINHLFIECVVIPFLFFVGLHSFAFLICLGIMLSSWLVFIESKSIEQIN
jgi:accessory gene regulator B